MAPMTGEVIKDFPLDLTSKMDIQEKTFLIIGGTSGLGQAIALEATAQGAKKVTVVGRSFKDSETSINFVQADLSVMKETQKIGETIETADIVVLTAGIFAAKERQETADGIESDIAISYLSRYVILQKLVPRLAKNSRIFIVGFPGSNVEFQVDDLNSEKVYVGVGITHYTTVAANEALVIDWANNSKDVLFFGLNPGLIKTGIRDNVYATGFMKYIGPVVEALIGLFSTSANGYAQRMIPLMVAQGLDGHSGTMFNPKAQAVKKSTAFETDADLAKKFMDNSAALLKEKNAL
jgi:NAD(P)-dependent dehydrogenase (short-subunit alcohol dehydrogenase family)